MEKFTPLAKFYTAAGSDGSDNSHLCTIVRSTLHFLGIYPRTEQKVVFPSAFVFITTHRRAYAMFLYLVVCDNCSTHGRCSNIY